MTEASISRKVPFARFIPIRENKQMTIKPDADALVDTAASPSQAEQPQRNSMATSFRSLVSKFQPTNYSMLIFRTINRDLCLPNSNDDYIAPIFRDQLMPLRGLVNRSLPHLLKVYKRTVEDVQHGVPGVCNFVDARTKWLDGAVKAALDDGFTQVVCIAAGYDTRAYRFYRQGVTFFEVDLPWASQKKQQLVRAAMPPPEALPRPTYIGADLSKVTLAEALAGTTFRPDERTLFTCEGLIYYLPEEAVRKLLASVAALAAPGSRMLFDFLRQDALDGTLHFAGYDNCAETCALKGEPFISGLPPKRDSMESYLDPLGFQLSRLWSGREMAERELPHTVWDAELPPIMDCYGYVEAVKPGVAEISPTTVLGPINTVELHKDVLKGQLAAQKDGANGSLE